MTSNEAERPWFLPESRQIAGFTVVTVLRSAGKTLSLSVQDGEGRPFAMKIPIKENAKDEVWRARFDREVQILRGLVGPAFPALRAFGRYAIGEYPEVPYIVTAMPIGPTLRDIIAQRKTTAVRPDVAGAPYLLRALAEALIEVHERGIVHRNLRPDKIAVAQGQIQILDFVLGLGVTSEDLTRTSEFLGTPDYIAPEQVRSAHLVDARADLYATGLIIYEYLTYDRAFGQVQNKVEAFLRHITQDAAPPSSSNNEVPRDLDLIVLKLLERDREKRFQSASELLARVDEVLQARRGASLSHVCLVPESGTIDGYRLQEALSSSGKTTILRVEDSRRRVFTMKVPSRQAVHDPDLQNRFERETAILNEVAGPSYPVLRAWGTYKAGGYETIPYLVTDQPAGRTLRELIDQRIAQRTEPDVAGCPLLLLRLALLLVEVHAKKIYPCSIRPDNIAVREGEVQLLEFVLGQGAANEAVTVMGGAYSAVAGYNAPEQLQNGKRVDGRADLFSLGVVAFEYLTFELPWGTISTRTDALLRQSTQLPVPPSQLNPAVKPEFDELIFRLLQRAPEDRYESAAALAADLKRFC